MTSLTHRLVAARARAETPREFRARLLKDIRALAAPLAAPLEASAGRRAPVGSAAWLREREIRYGGFVSGVARSASSRKEPARPHGAVAHRGGDRMSFLRNNYAPEYARQLRPYIGSKEPFTLVEVGILRGTGLAIWCDLFPQATVIGLDIDLSNTRANLAQLRRLGAFASNEPVLLEFDAYEPDTTLLADLLGDNRVSVVIDDGPHTIAAIAATAAALKPLLVPQYRYLIEDKEASLEQAVQVLRPAQAYKSRSSQLLVLRG
jgi:hypothetical protein